MPHQLCSFAPHQSLFSIFILPYFDEQFLEDSFGTSDQTVSDLKNNPTATQPDFNQSNRM
jgi:hypothetical protein